VYNAIDAQYTCHFQTIIHTKEWHYNILACVGSILYIHCPADLSLLSIVFKLNVAFIIRSLVRCHRCDMRMFLFIS